MSLKKYPDFNKSTWFLLPMICDPVLMDSKKNNCRETYLVDKFLINTYLFPNQDKRLLYVKYQNSPEVVDIEDYLTCDYLVDVQYGVTYTTYIYEIKSPEDIREYDYFVEGKYSEISLDYKWRIYNFFKLTKSDYLVKIFTKDEKLWHTINKNLGCKLGEKCRCSVLTTTVKNEIEVSSLQAYVGCPDFKRFEMPSRMSLELEEKINIQEETYETRDKK